MLRWESEVVRLPFMRNSVSGSGDASSTVFPESLSVVFVSRRQRCTPLPLSAQGLLSPNRSPEPRRALGARLWLQPIWARLDARGFVFRASGSTHTWPRGSSGPPPAPPSSATWRGMGPAIGAPRGPQFQ